MRGAASLISVRDRPAPPADIVRLPKTVHVRLSLSIEFETILHDDARPLHFRIMYGNGFSFAREFPVRRSAFRLDLDEIDAPACPPPGHRSSTSERLRGENCAILSRVCLFILYGNSRSFALRVHYPSPLLLARPV